jgi:hypothetical protein
MPAAPWPSTSLEGGTSCSRMTLRAIGRPCRFSMKTRPAPVRFQGLFGRHSLSLSFLSKQRQYRVTSCVQKHENLLEYMPFGSDQELFAHFSSVLGYLLRVASQTQKKGHSHCALSLRRGLNFGKAGDDTVWI